MERVAVFGGDERTSRADFPDGVRAYESRQRKSLLESISSGSLDRVVVLTRFVDHSSFYDLKRCCSSGGISFVPWPRGIPALAKKLHEEASTSSEKKEEDVTEKRFSGHNTPKSSAQPSADSSPTKERPKFTIARMVEEYVVLCREEEPFTIRQIFDFYGGNLPDTPGNRDAVYSKIGAMVKSGTVIRLGREGGRAIGAQVYSRPGGENKKQHVPGKHNTPPGEEYIVVWVNLEGLMLSQTVLPEKISTFVSDLSTTGVLMEHVVVYEVPCVGSKKIELEPAGYRVKIDKK